MDTSSSSATAAAASALGSSQNRINVPKDTSHQASLNSPPPAYTPRMASDPEQLLRQQMRGPFTVGRPPMAEAVLETMASENEDDEYQEEGTSAIWLRINTSVLISKNNNLVCLPDTPASHANAIAKAVVQAIQENSSGQCGIPMIDEDGRPRPVKIEVDAGITVEGSGNVVGSEDVVNQVLRQRGLARKRGAADHEDEIDLSAPPTKRRRGSGSSSSSSSNNNNNYNYSSSSINSP